MTPRRPGTVARSVRRGPVNRLSVSSAAWATTTLGEIVDIKNGATPSTRISANWDGSIPWCTPTDITNAPGKYLTETARSITEKGLASCGASLLPAGALLLCSRATIGEIKIASSPVCTNQGFKSLVCTEQAHNEFLYYFILTLKPRLVQQAIGSTFLEIGKHALASMEVRLPALKEQRAIAEALSDVDGLIESLESLIAKKQAVKTAAMQQLLTGKTRLPGFNGVWGTTRVSDFGEIVTGRTPPAEIEVFWGEQYPWITPTDISSRRDMITSERMITQEDLNSTRPLPENTVLVTCIASIGKNAILKTTGSCNQQINAVIPNTDHNPEFIYYLFEFSQKFLLANTGITATRIISKAVFSGLDFTIPPLDEQTAIAAVLSDMDAEIAALERRLDKIRTIKECMMQQLLTGRMRLATAE